MDCDSPIRSADALARLIARYDSAIGCAVMQIEEASLGDPVDCDRYTSLTLLLLALNETARTVRVVITEIVEADLCATYTPRVTCDRQASLPELLAEVATVNAASTCVVVEGAGEASVNGTYCPDGEENGEPVWTREGGTRLEDSIYYETALNSYVMTARGLYTTDPNFAFYWRSGAAGIYGEWPPQVITGSGGALPEPTVNAPAGIEVVLRVAKVTDISLECEDCSGHLTSAMEAMVASFVTDGTDTFLLIGTAAGTYENLDCDTAGISTLHLVRGALAPAGACGMMAWKTTIEA